jgi:integrase-like protein
MSNSPLTMTKQQQDELLKYLAEQLSSQQAYVIACLVLSTGIRKKELSRLRWSDINWDNRTIWISGKNGRRLALLSPKAQEALYSFGTPRAEGGSDFVIADPQTIHKVTGILKEAGRALGIPFLDFRLLRHTLAMNMVNDGVCCSALARTFGWCPPLEEEESPYSFWLKRQALRVDARTFNDAKESSAKSSPVALSSTLKRRLRFVPRLPILIRYEAGHAKRPSRVSPYSPF